MRCTKEWIKLMTKAHLLWVHQAWTYSWFRVSHPHPLLMVPLQITIDLTGSPKTRMIASRRIGFILLSRWSIARLRISNFSSIGQRTADWTLVVQVHLQVCLSRESRLLTELEIIKSLLEFWIQIQWRVIDRGCRTRSIWRGCWMTYTKS